MLPKSLVYFANGGIGLGHFLACCSVYGEYARKTNRKFFIRLKPSVLAMDPTADVDPIFTDFFCKKDIDKRGIEISATEVDQYVEEMSDSASNIVAVSREDFDGTDFIRRISNKNLDPSKMNYMRNSDYAEYLLDGRDMDTEVIMIFGVIPYRFARKVFTESGYRVPFAAFADERLPFEVRPGLSRCIGVHVRHGNGEHLHGRPEGGDGQFGIMLESIVRKAKEIKEKTGFGVVAFSDNRETVAYLGSELGADAPTASALSDQPHLKYLHSRSNENKYNRVVPIISDFYHLSNCYYIICGRSLFTYSAYLFSQHRNFFSF